MNNVKWISTFLLILAMPLLGFAQHKKKPAIGQSQGKKVYETLCIACHQTDGAGVPSMTPPLISSEWVSGDKTRLINVVLKGLQEKIEVNGEEYQGIMPANAHLSDQEIASVLSYIRVNFGNKATAISTAEVKAQREKE